MLSVHQLDSRKIRKERKREKEREENSRMPLATQGTEYISLRAKVIAKSRSRMKYSPRGFPRLLAERKENEGPLAFGGEILYFA